MLSPSSGVSSAGLSESVLPYSGPVNPSETKRPLPMTILALSKVPTVWLPLLSAGNRSASSCVVAAAVLLLNPKGGTVTHEGSLTNDQSSAACSGRFIDRKSAVGLKMTVIYSQTGRGIVIIIENRIYASVFWPGIAAAVNGKRCAPAQKDCLFQIIFSTLLNPQIIQSHICGAGNINAAGTATVFSCYKTGRMLSIDDTRTLAVTDSNCSRSDLKRRAGQTMPVQLDGKTGFH